MIRRARRRCVLGLAVALLGGPAMVWAYAYVGQAGSPPDEQPRPNQRSGLPVVWPDNRVEVALDLSRLDTDYADSTLSAMAEWNAVDTRLQLRPGSRSGDVCRENDNVNSIAWRATTCDGKQFDDALAITVVKYFYLRSLGRWEITEADIQINETVPWLPDAPGPMSGQDNDFRRVMLHEIGHVFGLDHPDEAGQDVDAIMNSRVSDLGILQDDDREGIAFLYGGSGQRSDAATGGSGGGGGAVSVLLMLGMSCLCLFSRRLRNCRPHCSVRPFAR